MERARVGTPVLIGSSLLLLLCACPGDDAGGPVALFELPREDATSSGYYTLPFPNDLRVRENGTINMDQHIRPNALLEIYVDAFANKAGGFGTNSAIFVRFTGAVDSSSLPATAADSLLADASVKLVDVDPSSPQYGEQRPLLFRFEQFAGEAIGSHWLSSLPFPGYPLRSDTTYALIISDRLRGEGDKEIQRSSDMSSVLSTNSSADDQVARARAVYRPLLDWLDEAGGDEREDVVVAAVFTTQDSVGLIGLARDVIYRDVAVPVARDVGQTDVSANYTVWEGNYDSPNFQTGMPPFEPDEGEIVTDANGDPIVQWLEPLRFAVTVPAGTMPAQGWPVVVYAHGTTGDYRTFIRTGTADRMATRGVAVICTDQPLHGPRSPDGNPPMGIVDDYENPIAARDTVRQAGIDDFTLTRLVVDLQLNGPSGPITFNADRVSFMGHSQGGITGSLFVPWEPRVKGAVLSGAGGLLYQTMLHREDVAEIIAIFIRDFELDQFNNLLALVQAIGDPADPTNYGPLMVRAPPAGGPAKDIYQSEGFVDSFTPLVTIEALGVAIGASPVTPVVEAVEGFELRGLDPLDPPISGNAAGATAVFVQYESPPGEDGHYVIYDVPRALRQHADFLGTLAADGRATLVP